MGLIQKYEKVVTYAVIGGAALLAFSLWRKGVGGTARDVTAGIVNGVVDAVGGVVHGLYDTVPQSLHPENHGNVVYSGVNKIGAGLTGDPGFNLGGWIYDVTH